MATLGSGGLVPFGQLPVGTSGTVLPVLSAVNTWSGAQTFSAGLTGTLTGHSTLDLALSGGTVAGAVTFSAGLTGTVTGHATLDLPLTGGTMTGTITAPTFVGALTGHASSDLALTGGTLSGALHMGTHTLDGSAIAFTGGTVDGVAIGGSVPGAGAFTTLAASGPFQSALAANLTVTPTGNRPNMFQATLSSSSSSNSTWENLNSFLYINGPGVYSGEINAAHSYIEVEAGATAPQMEPFEGSAWIKGSSPQTLAFFLSAPHIDAAGTAGTVFGLKSQLQNDNTTPGAVTTYAALDCEAESGGGSVPIGNYCIRNGDPNGLIASAGKANFGALGTPSAQLSVTGSDTSAGTQAFAVANSAAVTIFRVTDDGSALTTGSNRTIGTLEADGTDTSGSTYPFIVKNGSTIMLTLNDAGLLSFTGNTNQTGQVLVSGPDTTGSTYPLVLKNSSGAVLFSVADDGTASIGGTLNIGSTINLGTAVAAGSNVTLQTPNGSNIVLNPQGSGTVSILSPMSAEIANIGGINVPMGGAEPTPILNITAGLNGTVTGTGVTQWNNISVSADTASVPNAMADLATNHNFGGVGFSGGRIGFLANMVQTGAVSGTPGVFGNVVSGIQSSVTLNNSFGGSGTTPSTAAGYATGFNPYLSFSSGFTNGGGGSGEEIDVGTASGASFMDAIGLLVTRLDNGSQGARADAGVVIGGATPSAGHGWKTGISFGYGAGDPGIDPAGTMIGVDAGSGLTVANGLDFSAMTFSGNFLKSAGFSVGGTGAVTAAKLTLTSMPTSCSGQPTGTLWSNSGVVNVCP
jgi:hypothetical protein